MAKTKPIQPVEYTEEELLKMKKVDAIEGLNEKQQRFCEAYVYSHNIRTAMLKAGYKTGETISGYSLAKRPSVKRYIQWLKARLLRDAMISGRELIEEWVRIAFADMTDFVDVYPSSVKLKPSDTIDGQLVKAIKVGRDGVSIELYDKLKAMDSLAKYTQDMPKEFRQVLDDRRLTLLEEEFQLKKRIYDLESQEGENDGFLEAIAQSAKVVWENEIEQESI